MPIHRSLLFYLLLLIVYYLILVQNPPTFYSLFLLDLIDKKVVEISTASTKLIGENNSAR